MTICEETYRVYIKVIKEHVRSYLGNTTEKDKAADAATNQNKDVKK